MSIKTILSELEELSDTQYRQLLSGKTERRQRAMRSIGRLRPALQHLIALTLLNKVKSWISSDSGTEKTAFLDDIKSEAMTLAKNDKLIMRWLAGRAHRFSGRYCRAVKRYHRALEKILEKKKKEGVIDPVSYDIFSDYAEFLVYMGGADKAIVYLDANVISKGVAKSWHLWVKAFAIHQRGYLEAYRFGTAAGPDVGPASTYLESNAALDDVLNCANKPLSPSERCDTFLLRAANFGALVRGGDSSKKADALAARDAFMTGIFKIGGIPSNKYDPLTAEPVNASWSWQKELRGRFMKTYKDKYDSVIFGTNKTMEGAVIKWRIEYERHFRDNLIAAGFDESNPNDGLWDLNEDHKDDDC